MEQPEGDPLVLLTEWSVPQAPRPVRAGWFGVVWWLVEQPEPFDCCCCGARRSRGRVVGCWLNNPSHPAVPVMVLAFRGRLVGCWG